MVVPEEIRKCVAFIAVRRDSGEHEFKGSVFFIGLPNKNDEVDCAFAVTARHVVDGIRKLGAQELLVRLNLSDGGLAWAKTRTNDWYVHPTDPSIDVAILPVSLPSPPYDHRLFPLLSDDTSEVLKLNQVSLGDEVFITGLFRHHSGNARNIPIVRVGNIAALDCEPVVTRDFGAIEAVLIEARSIGGLSGSPVFVNLGHTRFLNGEVKTAKGGIPYLLLGIVHGHFDERRGRSDSVEQNGSESLLPDRINTGIAIVVPIWKAREVIDLWVAQHHPAASPVASSSKNLS